MTTPLEAALSYAARGWRVFPLKPGTKEPATAHGCLDATTDTNLIHQWWIDPNRGVGIATGRESGLWVVDVDDADSWHRLVTENDPVWPTPTVHTPRGGIHLYYTWDHTVEIRNSASLIAPGVDVRGDGGYVVAPGTPGYEWDLEDGEGPPRFASMWLVEAATTRPEHEAPQPTRPVEPLEDAPPGVWLNHSFDWGAALREQGARFAGVSGSHTTWTRPGKDAGVSATLGYLTTGDGVPRLKVFTPNWPGLNEGQTYDPLGYVAATRFEGSIQRAVEWAGSQRRLVEGDRIKDSFEKLLRQGTTITLSSPANASIPESTDDESGWEPTDWDEVLSHESDWPMPELLSME